MASDPLRPGMPDKVAAAEEDVRVVRELIAIMKQHADELRRKGVPVDDMIRTLERQIGELLAAAKKLEGLHAEDALLTQKRENLRRAIDGTAARLPPDLTDGMSTTSYLRTAVGREIQRKPRGKKGVGG